MKTTVWVDQTTLYKLQTLKMKMRGTAKTLDAVILQVIKDAQLYNSNRKRKDNLNNFKEVQIK